MTMLLLLEIKQLYWKSLMIIKTYINLNLGMLCRELWLKLSFIWFNYWICKLVHSISCCRLHMFQRMRHNKFLLMLKKLKIRRWQTFLVKHRSSASTLMRLWRQKAKYLIWVTSRISSKLKRYLILIIRLVWTIRNVTVHIM